MDKIIEVLERIGLSKKESITYISLLELKEARSGKLCERTRIPSSHIYGILDALIEKGLVSYRMQNNIKVFQAAPPKILNQIFLEKQKKLDDERKEVTKLISELNTIENKKQPYSDYKYYEGISGVKALFMEIDKELLKGEHLKSYTSKKKSYQNMVGFYNEFHRSVSDKKITYDMIFPKEDKELAEKRIEENPNIHIRFMDLNNEAEWGVTKDSVYIHYSSSKKPRGFLIKDKIFAETFGQVFDELWNKAEK